MEGLFAAMKGPRILMVHQERPQKFSMSPRGMATRQGSSLRALRQMKSASSAQGFRGPRRAKMGPVEVLSLKMV